MHIQIQSSRLEPWTLYSLFVNEIMQFFWSVQMHYVNIKYIVRQVLQGFPSLLLLYHQFVRHKLYCIMFQACILHIGIHIIFHIQVNKKKCLGKIPLIISIQKKMKRFRDFVLQILFFKCWLAWQVSCKKYYSLII